MKLEFSAKLSNLSHHDPHQKIHNQKKKSCINVDYIGSLSHFFFRKISIFLIFNNIVKQKRKSYTTYLRFFLRGKKKEMQADRSEVLSTISVYSQLLYILK